MLMQGIKTFKTNNFEETKLKLSLLQEFQHGWWLIRLRFNVVQPELSDLSIQRTEN